MAFRCAIGYRDGDGQRTDAPGNLVMSSSPGALAVVLELGRRAFRIVPGQVFDRNVRGAREPESAYQALYAPLALPA